MLRPIRIAFLAGLAALAAGLAVLFLSYTLAQGDGGGSSTPQITLSLAGLLLASAGGFLFLCTGPVLLVALLTRPKVVRERN